jgi:hypothetical protein
MTERQVRKALPLHPLPLILMVGVLLYVGLGFFQQAGVSKQRREELYQIEQEIATAQEELIQLEADLAYAQSPQAAEEWAREIGWARPDEVPVVVVAPREDQARGAAEDRVGDLGPDSFREAWWDLFFGQR